MTLSDINTLGRIKLSNSNQLGIVVQDIPRAVAYYTKLLNIGPWFRSNTVETEIYYRNELINLELDIVIAFHGGIEIELIQVISGDENAYSDILRKSGGGLHHLGFVVTGFNKKLARIMEAGVTVLQSGSITTEGGAVTRFAYLDTTEQCGIITELIDTKLLGIPMPHSKLIMNIGSITGDVERVKV